MNSQQYTRAQLTQLAQGIKIISLTYNKLKRNYFRSSHKPLLTSIIFMEYRPQCRRYLKNTLEEISASFAPCRVSFLLKTPHKKFYLGTPLPRSLCERVYTRVTINFFWFVGFTNLKISYRWCFSWPSSRQG